MLARIHATKMPISWLLASVISSIENWLCVFTECQKMAFMRGIEGICHLWTTAQFPRRRICIHSRNSFVVYSLVYTFHNLCGVHTGRTLNLTSYLSSGGILQEAYKLMGNSSLPEILISDYISGSVASKLITKQTVIRCIVQQPSRWPPRTDLALWWCHFLTVSLYQRKYPCVLARPQLSEERNHQEHPEAQCLIVMCVATE